MPFQTPPNGEYRKTKTGNPMHYYEGWQVIAFPHGGGFKTSIRAPTGEQAFEDQVFVTVDAAFRYAVESIIDPSPIHAAWQADKPAREAAATAKAATRAVEKEARQRDRVRQRAERTADMARRQEESDKQIEQVRRYQAIVAQWKPRLEALGLPCATWHELVKLLHPDTGGALTPRRKEQLAAVLALGDELKAAGIAIRGIAMLDAFGNPD